ncbi:MAG: hypothetical protein HY699_05740 [Deltaproteobacteria bacterium]|nr:hypothetical protein [Deltaproteobacteria bacterium]
MKNWVTQAEMEEKAQRKLDKALRELCAKRERTAADEHEITECLAEAAQFGMDVNVYAKLLAGHKTAA